MICSDKILIIGELRTDVLARRLDAGVSGVNSMSVYLLLYLEVRLQIESFNNSFHLSSLQFGRTTAVSKIAA